MANEDVAKARPYVGLTHRSLHLAAQVVGAPTLGRNPDFSLRYHE